MITTHIGTKQKENFAYLAGPARRALSSAGITNLQQLTRIKEYLSLAK